MEGNVRGRGREVERLGEGRGREGLSKDHRLLQIMKLQKYTFEREADASDACAVAAYMC